MGPLTDWEMIANNVEQASYQLMTVLIYCWGNVFLHVLVSLAAEVFAAGAQQ